jgi:hypothetical protein
MCVVSFIASDGELFACRQMVFSAPRNFCVFREVMNHTSICFSRFSRFSAALYLAWKRSASR